MNAVRAHLAEFDIVVGLGVRNVVIAAHDLLKPDNSAAVPEGSTIPNLVLIALAPLVTAMEGLGVRIKRLELEIARWHRTDETSRRLETIPGVGVMTASAMSASIADPSMFASAREFAAWLIGQFALAAAFVSQGEKVDHGAAGLPLRQTIYKHVEGSPIRLVRKELVTVEEVEQRHRLAAQ